MTNSSAESVNFSSTMSGLEILDAEDGTENTALPHNFTLSKIRSRGGREGDFNDDGANMISRLYYECLKLGRSKHSNETASQDDTVINQVLCPTRFDGWLCWEETPAGSIASQNCPGFVTGFDPKKIAHKTCMENGSWFEHPESGREWSNYTNCIDFEDFELHQNVNDIYFYGYSLSLVALLISLVIFMSFRSLRCTRIKIHINLFVSLSMSCIFWLIWYKYVMAEPDVIKSNSHWCVSLHIWLNYLMMVNYFWMFCEGMHLHLVLVVVFVKDTIALRWFFFFGWILPIVLLIFYSALRASDPRDALDCWINESGYMWILTTPVIMSLLVSLIFLINVVRVLLTKLHPCSADPTPLALKKAARATLILIPLFGLQHILLPFRPYKGSTYEKPYQTLSAFLVSLQGLAVSCLFCFINHDVILAVMCFLSHRFPRFFSKSYRESYMAPPLTTQSRDIGV